MALVATVVMADVSELAYDYHASVPMETYFEPVISANSYLPPPPAASAPVETYAPEENNLNSYLPPVGASVPAPEYYAPPATNTNGYLPPKASASIPMETYTAPAVNNEYLPPVPSVPVPMETYTLPEVNYNGYLPPVSSNTEISYATPIAESAPVDDTYSEAVNEPSSAVDDSAAAGTEFGDDGYRYKTVRRRIYRKRL
ncbi:uncharacterized protein LOC133331829 [Musca vetustissima]|uniref:uncharacterized protein LOC133331829 n=1 Tax=Musca vetustissima TaxID=27455 RepID=UPI002AB6C228|nr:uncharacterized protein LOC133331829 [Musca vetustissima]